MRHAHAEGISSVERFHGDEDGIDIEPFMPRAMDDVVETILAFGEYPAPQQHSFFRNRCAPRQFDLQDWVSNNVEPADISALYVSMVTDFSSEHDARRLHESAKVEAQLRAELADSEIVRERAAKLAREELEVA